MFNTLDILIYLTPELFIVFALSTLLIWGSITTSQSEEFTNVANKRYELNPSSINSFDKTYGKSTPRVGGIITNLSIYTLLIVIYLVFNELINSSPSGFHREGLIIDNRSQLLKLTRILATLACLIIISSDLVGFANPKSWTYQTSQIQSPTQRFEYSLLILLSLLGMRILVSANDLMVFYLALELQSLALYVLASSARGSAYSTEAGLKYFRLGAFASGLFLFGTSLIYGFLGTTDYLIIAQLLSTPETLSFSRSLTISIGFILIISAIGFKLASAPFHRWSPDVREGSPSTSARFFASVTKIAALGALIRISFGPFYAIWLNHIGFIPFIIRASLSRLIGALASLGQRRMKRFLAYSAIGHRGFRLIGISTGTFEGLEATLTYLILYVIGSLSIWSIVVASRLSTQYFTDLQGISRRQPAIARVIAISMFSRAGVPPRAGFVAKLSVLFSARQSSNSILTALAVFAIMISVIGAYYYLRIIKIRYFSNSNTTRHNSTITINSTATAWVITFSTFITLFILINPKLYSLITILVQRAVLSINSLTLPQTD